MVLAQVRIGQGIGQDVGREFLGKCNRGVNSGIVFGETHERDLGTPFAIKAVELGVDYRTRQFAGSVGAEIEKHRCIAVLHASSVE